MKSVKKITQIISILSYIICNQIQLQTLKLFHVPIVKILIIWYYLKNKGNKIPENIWKMCKVLVIISNVIILEIKFQTFQILKILESSF